jgi:three-Cys-motif partner protein
MVKEQLTLFNISLKPKKKITFDRILYPIWSEKKAQLIAQYLYYFVLITKHGTYIDGFSGPQKKEESTTWSAKLALEKEPKWLNNFYLFELDDDQYRYIVDLKNSQQDKTRNIKTFHGDFNLLIHNFLRDRPIKDSEATFCLLDQRTFECRWSTVKTIARYKKEGYKIELFYFLPIGWIDRALSAQKDIRVLKRWWGRKDWENIYGLKPREREAAFGERFKEELKYEYVYSWPIFAQRGGGRIMYYMIHASDHPEAPKLMHRAYKAVVTNEIQQGQKRFSFMNENTPT